MDKYQEALDEIFMQVNKAYIDACYAKTTKQSMRKVEDIVGVNIKILQELVDEKLEQESRKDYLKVGSQWEGVLDLICSYLEYNGETKVGYELLYETRVVTIVEVVNNYVKFKMDDYLCVIGLPQFLFCCRPLKEGE